MKNGRDPPQIRVDIGKRKKRKKKTFLKGQQDGTSGASAAYYSIDQRSKAGLRSRPLFNTLISKK